MLDPLLSLVALVLALAVEPMPAPGDPGPSADCPKDMRLVSGTHHELVAHLCLDPRGEGKATHCFRYADGLSVLEGPTTEIRVCMDRFEAPNQRGARPLVLQSFRSAERWCAARRKRRCTEQEWELACEGSYHLPLAYGWGVDVKICNSDKGWRQVDFEAFAPGREEDAARETDRLWQGSPSGRYRACISPFGLYDLNGNVEEWVRSREGRKFPGALMGGFWAKPWTGCRGTNDAHEPSFRFYETGFRCCRSPLQK
ncbi:MAG: SUMF1/EgtB/PvdO family nonheme iron enzyme [Deltaproteobacteria bacterium]|nr:SUMF1/EgtB/PvdO family nonheme iron enzyme [Deltaproteobacteria bacterium]